MSTTSRHHRSSVRSFLSRRFVSVAQSAHSVVNKDVLRARKANKSFLPTQQIIRLKQISKSLYQCPREVIFTIVYVVFHAIPTDVFIHTLYRERIIAIPLLCATQIRAIDVVIVCRDGSSWARNKTEKVVKQSSQRETAKRNFEAIRLVWIRPNYRFDVDRVPFSKKN